MITTPTHILPTPALDYAVADNAFEADVKAACQRRGYRALRTVRCYVSRDQIVLTGRLPSYFLKQLAQESVRSVIGCLPIRNEIEVGDSINQKTASSE